mgnify:CR=1 FL=1
MSGRSDCCNDDDYWNREQSVFLSLVLDHGLCLDAMKIKGTLVLSVRVDHLFDIHRRSEFYQRNPELNVH